MAKTWVFNLKRTGLMAIVLLAVTACSPTSLKNMLSFEKRPTEKPAFNEQNISKSFFVEANGKPKSFMCGWAAEAVNGDVAEGWITYLGHESMHCNVQFEITENYLIGRMINPSFPNDPSKWTAAVKIPISQHYYYEKRRDEYGRETNTYIENSGRSHWSARPMMKLNLAGLSIENWAYAIGVDRGARTPSVISVSEVEWAQKPSFLGFTTQVTSTHYGSSVQANFRFNFLQFEHDKNFKKIPYSQTNAKHFNILHIMGRTYDSPSVDNNELWVARWDLSKTTDLYLDNIPQKYYKIIEDSVEAWNATLQKIGASPKGVKAFRPIPSKMKHPFDLRYPAIHWVEDKRISASSPLGIGQAHADVLNGKIMYGLVVLWGGMLDEYIRSYTPSASLANGQSLSQYPFSDSYEPIPKALALPAKISEMSALQNLSKYKPDDVSAGIIRTGLSRVEEIGKLLNSPSASSSLSEEQKKSLAEEQQRISSQMENLQKAPGVLAEMAAVAGDYSDKMRRDTEETFSVNNLFEALGLAKFQPKVESEQAKQDRGEQTLSDLKEAKTLGREFSMKAKMRFSNTFLDEDRTIHEMVEGLASSPEFTVRNHDDILNSVITGLTLHEIGHFLNLGHQFKGNIVPESGTVPSKYVKELKALATPERGFLNYTTVMDYRSGRVEATTPVGTMKPGPHDELVLRYIYNGEYTTYDKEKDEFKFFKVGNDGVIPNTTEGKYNTGYFPACNDLEATYSADPFCNRWDAGTTAQDIVESYFQVVRDNLTSSLYAFSDAKGKNAQKVEANLWYRSLSNFSRVRLFYEEMRRYMRSAPHLAKLFNKLRKDEDSLHEFSKACEKENIADIDSPILKEMMQDQKLRDLCLANIKVLAEFKTLISLPDADYPLIDFKNRYIQGGYMGGETVWDIGKFFGTWYQMANYPIKAAALYTLTTAKPYIVWGGLYPNPFYDHEEDRYLYMMLFPREYTQIIADTVKYNLRFGDSSESATTTIGRSVLSLSWMIPMQKRMSNDFGRFPDNFVNMLTIQTKFDLGYMYILISGVDPEGEDAAHPRNFKRFTGSAFEPRANKSFNLTDVYILPQGRILSRANNAFLFPISNLRFFSEKEAFVVALKADFDIPAGDRLNEDSVKQSLTDTYDQIISRCIIGRNGAGLSGFFEIGKPEFSGFYIPPMIHQDSPKAEKMDTFLKSIDTEFGKFEKYAAAKDPGRSMTSTCNEAMRGVSQVLSTSALLSGTWIPLIEERLVK